MARTQRQLIDELEEELQTAHKLQMGLMPARPPEIEGLDIAGRCIPATHVGGDFYQYFVHDDKLILCLADVTGHAMDAAIPMVQFSGILKSEMQHIESTGKLLNFIRGIGDTHEPRRSPFDRGPAQRDRQTSSCWGFLLQVAP